MKADSLSPKAYREDLERRAADLQVRPAGSGEYLVLSSRGDRWYKVRLEPPGCECPAFARRPRICKHIVAVRSSLEGSRASETPV
jgi:uncharacterized Zn finger protein